MTPEPDIEMPDKRVMRLDNAPTDALQMLLETERFTRFLPVDVRSQVYYQKSTSDAEASL